VASFSDGVLLRRVRRRTSLRCQPVTLAVTTVRLGPAAALRSSVHRLPDPGARPTLPQFPGERQLLGRAHGGDEVSNRHRV